MLHNSCRPRTDISPEAMLLLGRNAMKRLSPSHLPNTHLLDRETVVIGRGWYNSMDELEAILCHCQRGRKLGPLSTIATEKNIVPLGK